MISDSWGLTSSLLWSFWECSLRQDLITVVFFTFVFGSDKKMTELSQRKNTCDQICENRPLPTFYSSEKNSSEVCVVAQLIDYSSFFYQIFSIASAGHDLHETMSGGIVWLHYPAILDSFCTNPEILGEKRAKSGRVGGNSGWGRLALHVFQANAGS